MRVRLEYFLGAGVLCMAVLAVQLRSEEPTLSPHTATPSASLDTNVLQVYQPISSGGTGPRFVPQLSGGGYIGSVSFGGGGFQGDFGGFEGFQGGFGGGRF